jgi:outer membrane protein OmpA-like peptidoglycan-associated protein
MRILITGFVVFVIWCFISAWLYLDVLLPAMKKPVPVQPIPELQSQKNEADSLAQLFASVPEELMIHFDFDKSIVKADQQTDIRITDFKNWLGKYPVSTITITGHTDFVGTEKYNLDLGLRRALASKAYLGAKGIPLARITAETKGETEPLGDNLTVEGRAMNRRTEISIKMQ